MTVRVVTDSTCDLPPALAAAHGIEVIPVYISVGERGYLDGVDLTRTEFYARLPAYDPPPTTASPGPEPFRQTYATLAADGADEVISIHVAANLSTVCNVATAAASTPTKTDTSLPLTALASTSRPMRSAPSGSVGALATSAVRSRAARSAHSW